MPFPALLLDQTTASFPQISHLLRGLSSHDIPSAAVQQSLCPFLVLLLSPPLPIIIQHAIYLTSLLKTSPFLES